MTDITIEPVIEVIGDTRHLWRAELLPRWMQGLVMVRTEWSVGEPIA
jgi:hypothetical protein